MEVGAAGLALGAGMLAAVNPCGFALLPAYLSLFVLDGGEPPRRVALARAARATVASPWASRRSSWCSDWPWLRWPPRCRTTCPA